MNLVVLYVVVPQAELRGHRHVVSVDFRKAIKSGHGGAVTMMS